MIITY